MCMSGLSPRLSLPLSPALNLIRMLGVPSLVLPRSECVESLDVFDYAFRNRIALLYLQTLADHGRLDRLGSQYERLCKRHNNLHCDIRTLTHSLEATGIAYAIVKTLRYYPANPNDIDVVLLGNSDECERATETVETLGYRHRSDNVTRGRVVSLWDPRRPKDEPHRGNVADYIDLDLYREIAIHELLYFDSARFRGADQLHTFVNIVDGSLTTARVLPAWLDLFLVYLHSIFPNRSYGLEVFYTTLYNLEQFSEPDLQAFVEFSRSVHLGKQIGHVLCFTQRLLKEALDCSNEGLDHLVSKLCRSGTKESISIYSFPYVYPLSFFLWTGIKAALTHKKGIQSAVVVMARMLNPRYFIHLMREILSHEMADERYRLNY